MTGRHACHRKHWLFEMRIVSVFTRLRLQHLVRFCMLWWHECCLGLCFCKRKLVGSPNQWTPFFSWPILVLRGQSIDGCWGQKRARETKNFVLSCDVSLYRPLYVWRFTCSYMFIDVHSAYTSSFFYLRKYITKVSVYNPGNWCRLPFHWWDMPWF